MISLVWAQAVAGASVYWYLLPLVLVISLVYSATRHDDWSLIVPRAVRLSAVILGFMVLAMAVLLAIQLL
jgi:hypothetical protein